MKERESRSVWLQTEIEFSQFQLSFSILIWDHSISHNLHTTPQQAKQTIWMASSSSSLILPLNLVPSSFPILSTFHTTSSFCKFPIKNPITQIIKTHHYYYYHYDSKNNTRLLTRVNSTNSSIVSPNDHWATWTALFATAAFGLWY